MTNQNGKKYGFTALFPILAGEHTAELRAYLRTLDANPYGSPLSEAPAIHMARLVVIDRLPYQGWPAKQDSLKSSYLLFLCEFDGESPEALARELADRIPGDVAEIWGHCAGFPGIQSIDLLGAYFERCQQQTNLFLVDGPDNTVEHILKSLRYKRDFAELVDWWQQASRPQEAAPPQLSELKRRLRQLHQDIEDLPAPHPGSL